MLRLVSVTVLSVFFLTACAWVKLTEQAESVRVSTAEQVQDCRRIGQTEVSVRDRVAAIQRRPGKVAEELERLARNEAGELGGNRIVAQGPVKDGKRTYAIFSC